MILVYLLLAFGPSLVWAYWLWSRDKFHREPMKLTATLLVVGGIMSVAFTLLFVWTFNDTIASAKPKLWQTFLAAPFPEEVGKMLPVLLFAWKSPHWDEPFDGIVYAGASALGFHLIETAKYMFEAPNADGTMFQALIRGAKPGHMLYGIAMGYFLSKAKFGAPKDRWKNFVLALAVPMALHTAWNASAGAGGAFVYYQGGNQQLFFSLIAWGLSVALWMTAYRYMRESQAASPWNPEAYKLQMAPTGCPTCGGGYPQTAVFCQSCGNRVQAASQATGD